MTLNLEQPPVSNRGVQSSNRGALRACVDWVQVTLQIVQPDTKKDGVEVVEIKSALTKMYELLGLTEGHFKTDESGFYGYRKSKVFEHIRIMYDHPAVPGFHIQLSGQGCREFESYSSKDWTQFIYDCIEYGGKFVRLDTAIDDIVREDEKLYFSMDKLYRKVKEGAVTSLFKKGKKVESFLIEDGSSLGETFYFGSAQSDVQIRFYEKDFEREAAGEELLEGIKGWNRTEIQLRRERAHIMATHLLNNPDTYISVVMGVLRNYINFRVKSSSESNKSKWDLCGWWIEFLDDAERLKLTLIAPDATIEKTQTWISKQVHPAMAMLFYANNSDMNYIRDMLEDGLERLTESQIQLAHDYQEKLKNDAFDRSRMRDRIYQDWMRKTNHEEMKEWRSTSGE